MRKFLIGICCIVMAAMCGCGGGESNDEKLTCSFAVPNSSVKLVPGEKFDIEAGAMKETTSYTEGASCYYDGMDKTFGYNGYTVTTYPAADGDYVSEVYITSSDIKTAAQITVGSSLEDVTKAYGNGYTVEGKMYKYNVEDGKYVYFYMSNDVVKGYGYAKEVK